MSERGKRVSPSADAPSLSLLHLLLAPPYILLRSYILLHLNTHTHAHTHTCTFSVLLPLQQSDHCWSRRRQRRTHASRPTAAAATAAHTQANPGASSRGTHILFLTAAAVPFPSSLRVLFFFLSLSSFLSSLSHRLTAKALLMLLLLSSERDEAELSRSSSPCLTRQSVIHFTVSRW